MQYFLFGLLALSVLLWASQAFVTASAAAMARSMRMIGGLATLGLGMAMLFRGSAVLGFWIAAVGAWVLLGRSFSLPWAKWPTGWSPGGLNGRPTPRNASRAATEHLNVELEHDTGAIRGTILKGFFAGRDLETLRPVELAHLWADCEFADPQSARILEAYLDRIHPTWRDDMARAASETGAGGKSGPAQSSDGHMSRDEAFDILGLKHDASEADIRQAHRDLMLKLHPDRGGSHILAAKVNEAKDVLLG